MMYIVIDCSIVIQIHDIRIRANEPSRVRCTCPVSMKSESALECSVATGEARIRQMGQKNESFGTVCPQGARLSSEAELNTGYHHKNHGAAKPPFDETKKDLTSRILKPVGSHRPL